MRLGPIRHALGIVTATAIAAVLVLAAPAAAQECENPATLRFSLAPTQNGRRELSYYQPILDLLAKTTGKKIDIFLPVSYSALIDALVGKRVDVALLGPEAYVIAHARDRDIEVFAATWRSADGIQKAGPGFESVLITRSGSPFTTIEALKGATLALVDPASTSGAMIPAKAFTKERRIPSLQTYFRRVTFFGGHDLSARAVAEGKVDAAFVATHRLMEAVNAGTVRLEDFTILWHSPQIPQDPLVTRGKLCDGLRKAVADTFLTADHTEEGRRYLGNIRAERMVPMTDSDYDIIRSIGK